MRAQRVHAAGVGQRAGGAGRRHAGPRQAAALRAQRVAGPGVGRGARAHAEAAVVRGVHVRPRQEGGPLQERGARRRAAPLALARRRLQPGARARQVRDARLTPSLLPLAPPLPFLLIVIFGIGNVEYLTFSCILIFILESMYVLKGSFISVYSILLCPLIDY